MKQQESARAAAYARSSSLSSSSSSSVGNPSRMTLEQIQRQASLPVAAAAAKHNRSKLLSGLGASPPRPLARTNSDPKMLPSRDHP